MLKQRYQQYDKHILDQRKNRPRLKLDDFHLLRTLGTGSFGRVHLSQSRHNARYYAIKVLKKTEVVRLKQGNIIMIYIYICYLGFVFVFFFSCLFIFLYFLLSIINN